MLVANTTLDGLIETNLALRSGRPVVAGTGIPVRTDMLPMMIRTCAIDSNFYRVGATKDGISYSIAASASIIVGCAAVPPAAVVESEPQASASRSARSNGQPFR